MPCYRIHRIKESPRENFRWAAHLGGEAIVKLKDYDPTDAVEAPNPYAAWKQMAEQGSPLRPGDILETLPADNMSPTEGELLIVKYIGFEPARWFIPEVRKADTPADLPSFSVDASKSKSAHS